MRIFLVAFHGVFFLSANCLVVRAGDWFPVTREIDRYAHIWKAAPFTAASNVSSKAGGIAARFTLTGFARVGAEEVIFLFDRADLSRFSVTKSRPENGVTLVEVLPAGQIKDLKVRIRAGEEIALISYEAEVATAAARVNAGSSQGKGKFEVELEEKGETPPAEPRVIQRRIIKSQP